MTDQKKDIVEAFKKEDKKTKYILISAAAFLLASFLPWISVLGIGVNGWSGLTSLGNLAAIATIAFWALPKFKVDLGDMAKKTDLIYKALSAIMAASAVLFVLQAQFKFTIFGIGAYLGMISAGAAVYFSFNVTKKHTPSK